MGKSSNVTGYPAKDAEENFNHAAKQAYIAFSRYCCCCFEGVDSSH
jgi:hypothetical protein